MLMHRTKYQQCLSFVLGLGVLKVFITLNSYDWLKVHSVPDSISMVHQSSSNVCNPLLFSPFHLLETRHCGANIIVFYILLEELCIILVAMWQRSGTLYE
jgi:hypothetical protein